ncbi:LytTR family DNA-binding domain-containing protein [Hymenobacter ginsengisoli]|uniref:LytTR family DNA-binding domain-containing protein n=1 Tax=Hymenobacter ginsengisoli TaxID=1051626 RepID=A0ABP8PZE6_9BACT|nr:MULTISPECIES: LytTR family DNA-binding domain-containing protein [unclassified Hymenobacter]MBO2032733.1 response regulator transcription factor [Hymenobacter sp. BT559]
MLPAASPTPLRCAVLDDDPLSCDLVASYVARVPSLVLVGTFSESVAAFEHLSRAPVDLLFSDIELPGLNGLELVRGLRQPPLVVFLTSHPEYALPTYELDAVDFLVKPLAFPRFLRAVDKALRLHVGPPAGSGLPAADGTFFIRTEQQFLRLRCADVAYAEAMRDFVKVHLTTGAVHVTLVNLKNFEEQVPAGCFLRTHRSFLVNKMHITAITADEVRLGPALTVPLGQSFREEVLAQVVQQRLVSRHPAGSK